jgi:hypothetical protein
MQPDPNTIRRQHRDVKTPVLDFVGTPFSTLMADQRAAIAVNGFDMIVKEAHPWLTDAEDRRLRKIYVECQA